MTFHEKILAMRTAGPTARPALPFFELRAHPLDMLSPCFGLFYGDGPANPFIARKRRDVSPGSERGLVGGKGFPQIRRDFVNDAAGDCFFRHIFSCAVRVTSQPETGKGKAEFRDGTSGLLLQAFPPLMSGHPVPVKEEGN